MRKFASDEQKREIISVLKRAMAILRDDRPFSPRDSAFGQLISADKVKDSTAGEYVYNNRNLPESRLSVVEVSDPLDYSEDRAKVRVVPGSFQLYFYGAVSGVSRFALKSELDLADYWVDYDNQRHEGNDIGAGIPPAVRLHRYEYRANPQPTSRFPVNVTIFFFDPLADDSSGQALNLIRIERAYPILTPQERKQKREQQNHEKREKYGYMNLCTGMICPESGLWEGWTMEGPTDILRVTKGDKFDVVRTVSADKGGTCPMINGQWMWLCPPDEIRGFVWKGMRLS